MDTARYVVALLAITAFPAAMLYWVLVHPFVRFWRRFGLVPSYIVLSGIFFTTIGVVYSLRGTLLAVEYGTHWRRHWPTGSSRQLPSSASRNFG
jgi:hypothetical protein